MCPKWYILADLESPNRTGLVQDLFTLHGWGLFSYLYMFRGNVLSCTLPREIGFLLIHWQPNFITFFIQTAYAECMSWQTLIPLLAVAFELQLTSSFYYLWLKFVLLKEQRTWNFLELDNLCFLEMLLLLLWCSLIRLVWCWCNFSRFFSNWFWLVAVVWCYFAKVHVKLFLFWWLCI